MDYKSKLKETAKDYIANYPSLLAKFLNDVEAEEKEFIEKESNYFEFTLQDLSEDPGIVQDYSFIGYDNYLIAKQLIKEIGPDKFYYSTEKKIDFLSKKLPSHHQTETEQEIPSFENNFDKTTPIEIYNHFKTGLVERQYLTEQELNKYLKAAFEFQKIPEKLFKLLHIPAKQKIYTVFYVYFKDIAHKKHGQQEEYADLLGKYFEGFKTSIIKTNWAREYQNRR